MRWRRPGGNYRDVRDAAQIERNARSAIGEQDRVDERHERRAVPACGRVGRTKVVHDGNAGAFADPKGIPELQRMVCVPVVRERHAVRGDGIEHGIRRSRRERISEGSTDVGMQRRKFQRADGRGRKRREDAPPQFVRERDRCVAFAARAQPAVGCAYVAYRDVDRVE